VKLATSEGLDIGNTATELAKLGEAHSNHWARYPYDIGQPVFAVENFDPHVEKLIEAVSRAIRGRPAQT
jgi:hypothetical protein